MFRIHESTPDSESLVLTDHKNNYFTKIGGTKINHGPNSRGTSRTQRPSTKNFFKARIYRKFGVFWKACIVTFQKSNIYVPTNNLKLQSYSINCILALPIFSKFQLWSQIWQRSSTNFVPKFKSYNLQLITFPKGYLVSKSNHWNSRYLQLKTEKRVKSTEIYIAFSSNFTRFWTLNW